MKPLERLKRGVTAFLIRAGRRRLDGRDWRRACALFRMAAILRRSPRILTRLGLASLNAKDIRVAVAALREATATSRRAAMSNALLGSAYLSLGCRSAARLAAEAALQGSSLHTRAYAVLAEIRELEADGDPSSGFELLHAAVELSQSRERRAAALLNLAQTYANCSRKQESIDCSLRALDVQPNSATAFTILSVAGYYNGSAHPHVRTIMKLADKRSLSVDERAQCHFTLGRIYDKEGNWAHAFTHFRRGNSLRSTTFRPRQARDDSTRRMATFTAGMIDELSRHGSDSDSIICVVGMPRSGTTLIEQILDSHPDVKALGERTDLWETIQYLPTQLSWTNCQFPECCTFLNSDYIRDLSQRLLSSLSGGANGASKFVTKRPNDFWDLGLIRILFPKAKIIHCRRHPVDTCLSCYMQDFSNISFANRLRHLAAYYQEYEEIMAHWRNVLGTESIYELQYERLVSEPDATIDEVLRFCKLKSSEACRDFHRNTRPVYTASMWQVRQPIYHGSIDRWRNYEPFLGPLRRLAPMRGNSLEERPNQARLTATSHII